MVSNGNKTMNLSDLALMRLESQQLAFTQFKTAGEIVRWMCAMQAQDYTMAKWALGIRLPGSTDKMIEESLVRGEVIRTHVLRPTWHLVSPEDITWMLDLTAPRIKSSLRSRNKDLGLTSEVLLKSNTILGKALERDHFLNRESLIRELHNARIPTDNNRASHLLLWAELEGLICSGVKMGNNQIYALLSDRVPKTPSLSREEALAKLARRYFFSHGPATVQDFAWWSGLSGTDAKRGLEMNKPDLLCETIGDLVYWFSNALSVSQKNSRSAFLIPSYDEFIISYKYRNAVLSAGDHKKSISSNGIFRPVIVVKGQVTGLWKRTANKDKVIVETALSRNHSESELNSIAKAGRRLGLFLEKALEIQHIG
jgi:hypothetical protein